MSLLLSPGLLACTVPVFRYALDNWHPDAYVLELSPDAAREGDVGAFVRNLADNSPMNLQLKVQPDAKGSSAKLSFPGHDGLPPLEFWSGDINAAALARLTNSPARAEISRRILTGDSLVWVFVESGDKETDDTAIANIEKRLAYLGNVADLPAIDPNDPTSRLGPGPELKAKFSLLRVKQSDPDEQAFLKMLAGPKADSKLTESAWLAAVFGRGRVLGAWPAKGFGPEQVDEVCLFLLGACSCQVKNLNPGWDLLMHTSWDDDLMAVAMGKFKGTPAPSKAVEEAPLELVELVTNTIMPQAEDAAFPEHVAAVPEPWSSRQMLLGLAALSMLAAAAATLLRSRNRPS